MKNLLIVLGVIILLVLVGSCSYNGIVKKDVVVKAKWSNVQSDYQRRSDLIPNLVATVKGVANFEKSTMVEVTEARAKATSIQVDASKLDADQIQKFQAAQGQLSTALGRLLVASENYPQLKANENFSALQSQLEGTENRINVSRRDFNDAVQDYNGTVRSFLVAHGKGSDPEHDGWLKSFSNMPGSEATSRGSYLTCEWYNGKYGTSIRLVGLDQDNSQALARAIVMHPAKYVDAAMAATWGKIGRSEGCFAMSNADFNEALWHLSGGRLLYADRISLA